MRLRGKRIVSLERLIGPGRWRRLPRSPFPSGCPDGFRILLEPRARTHTHPASPHRALEPPLRLSARPLVLWPKAAHRWLGPGIHMQLKHIRAGIVPDNVEIKATAYNLTHIERRVQDALLVV